MQFQFASLFLTALAAAAPAIVLGEECTFDPPKTCAFAYDDPHIETFDAHKYDCQGQGDYVLSKSVDSDFELQGRFYEEAWGAGLAGTTTTAAVLNTGNNQEPKVQVSYNRQCDLKYFIDDQEQDLENTLEVGGYSKNVVEFSKEGKERYFDFQKSGIRLHVTLRLNHAFGCFVNVKLCLPDDIKNQNIVGVFGSPDGKQANDYMDRQGNDLEKVGKIWWGQINDYCKSTWCIDGSSFTDNMFDTPGDTALCKLPYDDSTEKAVENAPQEIIDMCGGDQACIIDAMVAGGNAEVGAETLNDERGLEGDEGLPCDCPDELKMETAVCELPEGASDYSVVTIEDAHIGAHSMYKGLAIGGVLYDATPGQSGTVDSTMSYIHTLDGDNSFNFNAGKELGKSCMSDSMTARLRYIAQNAQDSQDGDHLVKVIDDAYIQANGNTFDVMDFRGQNAQGSDNGKTLVIFNTSSDIIITDAGGRQFGPTIIAPFSEVFVTSSAGYVDGSIYAKSLRAEGGSLQLHGKTYKGTLECGSEEEKTGGGVDHSCGALGSETAFARPDDGSGCFIDDGHSRWGWSIDITGSHSGSYTYDVYAGAGQCDIDKGELVGTVTVVYDAVDKTCEGSYQATGGHTIEEFQFYCGASKYPQMNNGADTVAPGKYSCVHSDTETKESDTCVVDDVEPDTANGDIFAIAHAVSCNAPSTPAPNAPAPTPAPTPGGGGNCVALYGKCGGKNYNGATCCQAGSYCDFQNEWYSQCEPGSDPNGPSPTKAPTTPAPTPGGGGNCKAVYKKCGGKNYNGATCCQAGSYCDFQNEWYSQCKPGSDPNAPSPTEAPETPSPTDYPTASPTEAPETPSPTALPTEAPETPSPTDSPTEAPETPSPTASPTEAPETPSPTDAPKTPSPTDSPTEAPENPLRTDPPETASPSDAPTDAPEDKNITPAPSPQKGSSSGDPHFKTWTGDKYDYHGECDLVLVDHPSFMNGLGLRVHIRTTRVKYFSYIEQVAVQIGSDTLEFDNDVENFLINGEKPEANHRHHKTLLGGFVVRRDTKAISIRLHDQGRHDHHVAKIDLFARKNGFPAVVVDGGATDIFKGSLGLLGDWETGKRIARDGMTEMNEKDATPFALEWQVRDTEPMLFKDARLPQYPTTCTPPAKMGSRLGASSFRKEAEEACGHWKEDKEDCIFDVIATRDVLVASEGHLVTVE